MGRLLQTSGRVNKTDLGARPSRVLFLASDMGGGTGTHLSSVIHYLVDSGVEVRVLCQGPIDVELPDSVKLIRRPTYHSWDRFPLAQVRDFWQAASVVRRFQPDVVHAVFFWAIIHARLLRAMGIVPHLVENREDQGFNWSPVDYRILRSTARLPDRVVCVSQAVREVVLDREALPESRVVVIHNGIRTPSRLGSSEADIAEARRSLGIAPQDRVVGMVSNFNRDVKGAPYFLESMPSILTDVPRARFVIFGEGPRSELEAHASRLGVSERLIFAGYRDDMARWYPIMDVSVLTSLSEGLSMTILESMSYGIPVVATRVGGNPELVVEGETGCLVPAKDPNAFSAAVVRILKDASLARRLGDRAREHVLERFSADGVGPAYAALYSRVRGLSE